MPRSVFTDAYAALISTVVEARKHAGITQVELSRRLGKPQSFISKIEQGQRRLDMIEFCAIAQAMNQDPSELFEIVLRRLPKRFSI